MYLITPIENALQTKSWDYAHFKPLFEIFCSSLDVDKDDVESIIKGGGMLKKIESSHEITMAMERAEEMRLEHNKTCRMCGNTGEVPVSFVYYEEDDRKKMCPECKNKTSVDVFDLNWMFMQYVLGNGIRIS